MTKEKPILIACVAIAILAIAGTFFLFQLVREEKTPPVLHAGDEWKFTIEHGQALYTQTRMITGEEKRNEKDCYIGHELTVSHHIARVENAKVWIDKSTLHIIRSEVHMWLSGASGLITTTRSYEWQKLPFPLEVGKEFGVVIKSTVVSTLSWIENKIETENLTCKIEGIENITTSAGVFETFRWATYDNQGNIVRIKWYSREAKTFIKEINVKENMTRELTSYSVQDF